MGHASTAPVNEKQVARKVWRRILPVLCAVFFCAWLDKINIGFAALQMNAELGLSNTSFGLAAGFFSLGYVLFTVPGALMLKRVDARLWIGIMMILCGLSSMATAFVSNVPQLLGARAVLGIAESSLYPACILLLGRWLPNEYRGRAVSFLLLTIPVAFASSGPVAGALLKLHGMLGLSGWQWLFLIEALPTFLAAYVVLSRLERRVEDARWLEPDEKNWLLKRLEDEASTITRARPDADAVRSAFASVRIWVFAAVNFCLGAITGITFFLPLMVKSMGFSTTHTGFLVAVPLIGGALTLPLWGRWTDRVERRELVVASAGFAIAAGLLGAALLLPSPWALAAFALAMCGVFGNISAITLLPYAILSGAGVVVGVAIINTANNLGQFGGSYLIGKLSDWTGTYAAAMAALGLMALFAALVALSLGLMRRKGCENPA